MTGPERHRPILAQLLRELSAKFSPLYAAEIGVASGLTSEYLLRDVPELRLLMIDPWLCPASGTRKTQADYDAAAKEATRRTDFAEWRRNIYRNKSLIASTYVADNSLALVFIDACHFYESVFADCVAWWPKVAKSGLLTGHDFFSPKNDSGVWGVRKAVEEFAANLGSTVEHQETVWILRK